MMNEGVSVFCLTYNHAKYIRNALDGFVIQNVDFPYEVWVHDDASNDGTAEIVKEYSEKYPDIIKAILQKENQYSKGIEIVKEYIRPHMKYKYISICEGDDYWTDPNKIKKQYEYMQNNDDVSLCVHNTRRESSNGDFIGNTNESLCDRSYSVEEIIAAGGGGLFHTSSYMIKKEIESGCPDELLIPKIGDYPLAIYAAIKGRVFYFKDIMSVYRVDLDNSWTKKTLNEDVLLIQYLNNMISYFEALDKYTNSKYRRVCEKERIKYEQELILKENSLAQIFMDKRVRERIKRMPIFERIRTVKRIVGRDVHKV